MVTQAIKLKIDGVGDFEIAPGGADLIDLAREAETILGLQTALSNRLGVSSLPEAELRFASYQQATTDAKHAERALSLLAPYGVDALRSELDQRAGMDGVSDPSMAKFSVHRPQVLGRHPCADHSVSGLRLRLRLSFSASGFRHPTFMPDRLLAFQRDGWAFGRDHR